MGSIGSVRSLTKTIMITTMVVLTTLVKGGFGIRFVIDREECVSHNVEYEGDTVHISFVVIKADDPWHYGEEGVDLVVSELFLSSVIFICLLTIFSGNFFKFYFSLTFIMFLSDFVVHLF